MSTCGDCKFFIPEPEQEPDDSRPGDPLDDSEGAAGGTCHEDSPKAIMRGQMVEDGDNEVIWPWVASDDWCGRWKKV